SQPSRVPRVAAANHGGVVRRGGEGGHPDGSAGGTSGVMVPAEPLSKRSKNFGTIPRRQRCLDGASNFGKEKSLDKAKARQAPSFHLSGWRGFYLRQIRFFAHRLFAAMVRAGRRIGPQCEPFILRCCLRPRLQRRRRRRTSTVPC